MGVPAVLLRPDQFTGWTGCLMELIRRPVPQARPRRPGRVRGPGEGRSARLCARCRSRQRSVASPCAGLRPGAEGEAELRKACGVPQRPRGPQAPVERRLRGSAGRGPQVKPPGAGWPHAGCPAVYAFINACIAETAQGYVSGPAASPDMVKRRDSLEGPALHAGATPGRPQRTLQGLQGLAARRRASRRTRSCARPGPGGR